MKMKMNKLMMAAVAATMLFASCSNEENATGNTEAKSVFLKIAGSSTVTRADEATGTGNTTTISTALGGNVYFTDGTNVVDHVAIGTAAGEVTVAQLLTGYTFTSISGSATDVYVVVNKPAGFTLPTSGALSVIKAVAMNITNFTTIGTLTMQGTGAITAGAANVPIAPVVARFEIAKVEYDATHASSVGNVITSYELAGIFVNNHHKTMGLNYTHAAAPYSSTTDTDYAVANFPAPLSDIFAGKTGATSYQPTNAAWAYQIFPINTTDAIADQPMIVVHLKGIAGASGYANDQFISINKFEDANNLGTYITTFEANKIYKIASIKFSNRNLSVIPGTLLQDVTVTVSVTAWTDVNIIPQL